MSAREELLRRGGDRLNRQLAAVTAQRDALDEKARAVILAGRPHNIYQCEVDGAFRCLKCAAWDELRKAVEL